ncbi:DUF397 domain-containing protein [Micromonospora tarensis]|uniref:DUF397 domain-containing protein n=1 Tax=Micromonospora tarensis TaxID=2806100 RepID=A0ABS1YEM3_9ACTN|nr:DUF397 domain-containing protein [Micromonospora tarensis]MBM0275788.1 DUF397 domain-containing protein [Micromonospora tarensis]
MEQLKFVKPNRCDNSGPNCLEVAIDKDSNRILRNSRRPETQIVVDADEWAAFADSLRAGQSF